MSRFVNPVQGVLRILRESKAPALGAPGGRFFGGGFPDATVDRFHMSFETLFASFNALALESGKGICYNTL